MHPEFPQAPGLIYLNHAAVAPWPLRTREAVTRFAEENSCYGAANYPHWLHQEKQLREQLRDLLNASSTDDIALVKNTSEAISFVAFGFPWRKGDNIVSTNEEFPSNRIPWQVLANRGVEFRQADCRSNPAPEDALFQLTDRNTRLIAVSSVQYGSGLRLDLERIGAFCRQRGIHFLVDAIQSLGALRFDIQSCGADFVMADGHKWMLGPEGLGVFYCSERGRELLDLTQYGWHMVENSGDYDASAWKIAATARRFECGSPNMLGIHALSASLSLLLETGMEKVEELVLERSGFLADRIASKANLELIPSRSERPRSGIVVFRHRTADNETLFAGLKKQGVVCALRGGGIRFSPHFYMPIHQLEEAVDLADALA